MKLREYSLKEQSDKAILDDRIDAIRKAVAELDKRNAPVLESISDHLSTIEGVIYDAEQRAISAKARRDASIDPKKKPTATTDEVQEKLEQADTVEDDGDVDGEPVSDAEEVQREGFSKDGEPLVPPDATKVADGTDWDSGVEDEASGD